MKRTIFCSEKKHFNKYPYLKFKMHSLKNLDKLKNSLLIVDYNSLTSTESVPPLNFQDNVIILYLSANMRKEAIKILKEYNFFDYITNRMSRDEIEVILRRARDHLTIKKQIDTFRKIDPNLGCYNWQFFTEYVPDQIEKAKRNNYSISFIILDIDYFRQITESYGYEFADYILKELLRILKKNLPSRARLIRFREDAFIITVPYYGYDKAELLADKIRKKIYTHSFKYRRITTHISLSLGVVSLPERDIADYRNVIVALEKTLQVSKREGGNLVTVYSPQLKKEKVGKEVIKDADSLKRRIKRLNREINQTIPDMIYGFAKTIEARDLSTAKHVEEVAYLTKRIAKKLNLSSSQIEEVYHAAILHDLGKIGVPPEILLKKNKLNKEDWEIIKTHPWIATEILREIHILKGVLPAILYHHERWDGKGYPLGLKGEEIPLPARIVAIADVYHALISDRPYRKAFSKKEAIEIIRSERGKYFDPRIVDIFLDIIQKKKRCGK